MKGLLGREGVGGCPGLSNRCMCGLDNQQAGSYTPANELELISFWPFPFGGIVWHLSTQVNYGIITFYIIVSDPRRGERRRFILFLVYALVYPIISSNLVTLTNLSIWSDSVSTHNCSPFLRKPPLR